MSELLIILKIIVLYVGAYSCKTHTCSREWVRKALEGSYNLLVCVAHVNVLPEECRRGARAEDLLARRCVRSTWLKNSHGVLELL